jgi:hypothetical protein
MILPMLMYYYTHSRLDHHQSMDHAWPTSVCSSTVRVQALKALPDKVKRAELKAAAYYFYHPLHTFCITYRALELGPILYIIHSNPMCLHLAAPNLSTWPPVTIILTHFTATVTGLSIVSTTLCYRPSSGHQSAKSRRHFNRLGPCPQQLHHCCFSQFGCIAHNYPIPGFSSCTI